MSCSILIILPSPPYLNRNLKDLIALDSLEDPRNLPGPYSGPPVVAVEEVEEEDLGEVQKREWENLKEKVDKAMYDLCHLALPTSQRHFDLLKQRSESFVTAIRSNIRQETGLRRTALHWLTLTGPQNRLR